MNAKISLNYLPLAPELWITGTVLFFAKCYVKNPSALLKDLLDELDHDQLLIQHLNCHTQNLISTQQSYDITLLNLPDQLKKWIQAEKISKEELFSLCFLAELENNYNLNLLLQELQGPQQDNQLSMHFLCDLLSWTFSNLVTPTKIQAWTSVKHGLLVIHKKGPLILSQIQLQIDLWQLCSSTELETNTIKTLVLEQSSRGLLPVEQDLIDQLAISIRIQHYSGVALAAEQSTSMRFAIKLSQSLHLTAVIPDAAWKGRLNQLGLVAKVHQLLLVLDFECWKTDWISSQESNETSVLIYSSSKTEEIEFSQLTQNKSKLFFYRPEENTFSDRLSCWQLIAPDEQAKDYASRWLMGRSNIEKLIKLTNPASVSPETLADTLAASRVATAPGHIQDLAFHVSLEFDKSNPINTHSIILQKRLEADLQSLFRRCLQRETIFSGLGGNLGKQRSAGVKALFSGESGTGKTLAARVLAHQLGIPIYRLDLGSVLNKYVGETEKNIHKLLEQIALEDYILLIDEADALFGKRTDAESGGERFANMLTNYLLARIEQHQGIVLMTTNGLGRIDSAFMRRFDKVIEFLPPEFDERMAIWKSLLGDRNPGDAYCRQLASLCELSGGFIRNAILSAAAEVPMCQQTFIPYSVLLTSLAREYAKSGKPIPPKLTQHLSQQLDKDVDSKNTHIKESMI